MDVCYSCKKNACCCSNMAEGVLPPVLAKEEIDRISRETGRSTDDFVDWEKNDKGARQQVMKLKDDGSCYFFSSGRCGIHPFKPAECALYPFDLVEESGAVYWMKIADPGCLYAAAVSEAMLHQLKAKYNVFTQAEINFIVERQFGKDVKFQIIEEFSI